MSYPSRQLAQAEYPPGLLEIPEPPQTLFLRGTLPQKENKLLSVVGSRTLSAYGKAACERLIMNLTGQPITIVSGLALGTDAFALETALKAGLHTIAIPGSSIEDEGIAPRTNFPLAKRILESGGALLSEYPKGYQVHKGSFPRRNRIMVGVSHAVLVIEAGERSGTLITARLAGDYNRELLCVPHRLSDPNGYGSHQFIRLGATLVSHPDHILEALALA